MSTGNDARGYMVDFFFFDPIEDDESNILPKKPNNTARRFSKSKSKENLQCY